MMHRCSVSSELYGLSRDPGRATALSRHFCVCGWVQATPDYVGYGTQDAWLLISLTHWNTEEEKSQSAVLFIDLGCRLRRTRPLPSSAPRHIAFLEPIRLYSENQLPSHMKGQLRRTIVLTSMT